MPVDVEVNLDPLEVAKAVGVAGIVAVVGGLVAYVAWEGLTLGTPLGAFRVIEGLKDTPFWKAQAERAAKLIEKRQLPAGFFTDAAIYATDTLQIPCDQARVLYHGLSDFARGFCKRNGLSSEECAAAWKELKERCNL